MRAYRANLASDERRSSPRPPRETLADRALVAINTIPAIEADRPYPKSDTTTAVRQALKKGGMVFLTNGAMGESVWLAVQ